MSKSPTFTPDCITSDGASLYAISRINQGGYAGVETIVLAKSNANALSILDLTWNVVSTVPQSNHYILTGVASIGSFNCYVDPKGVFTILAGSSKSSPGDQTRNRSRGYQYNPADGGKWSNVDVTDDYKWGIVTNGGMFSMPIGESQVLMHAYRTGITVDTITLAMFNTANMTFVEQNRTWALPDASGTPYYIVAGNNSLYAVSNKLSRNNFLNILPLNPTANPPPLTSVKAIPATIPCEVATGYRARMWVSGSTYYLFCADQDRRSWLITSDGNTIAPAINVNTTIRDPEAFFPLGPEGGPPTWAFLSSDVDTFGLTLSGSNAGSWQEAPYKFTVVGLPGSNSGSGGGGSGGSGGSAGGSSGLSTTGTVAIGISAFMALIIIGSFLLKRCCCGRRNTHHIGASYLSPATAQYSDPQQQPMTQTSPSFPPPPPPTNSDYEYQQQGLESQQPCPPYTSQTLPTMQNSPNPQQHPNPPTSMGHPQSHEDMEAHSTWSPFPSDITTLAFNSPQYTNVHSQDPQLYVAPPPPTSSVLTAQSSLMTMGPRNPQLPNAPGAPQTFNDEPLVTEAVLPADYRRAPQDRLQDHGNQ
ncbi:hypothetical protein BG011_009352 [Mortierella polycephala]|uniref:Uncharacterized protein n=1 Tax=Mortierella polycephala TaxID=41804 RepID=A0A9P6Q9P4_9FUNG|nr:hypothetical protein BG011_009352 [Mortierella polycephala]